MHGHYVVTPRDWILMFELSMPRFVVKNTNKRISRTHVTIIVDCICAHTNCRRFKLNNDTIGRICAIIYVEKKIFALTSYNLFILVMFV